MSEVAAVAPVERGFFAILCDVFVAPGDAFRAVAARPRWEAPLVLAIAVGLAFTAVWMAKADGVEFMRAQMEEAGAMEQIPPEKREAMLQGQAKWMKAFAWVGPLFLAPLGYAALAGLFLFIYRFFYAAEVSYPQSLSVVAWCFAAFGLVMNPLILIVMALKDEWSVDPQSVVQASAASFMEKAASPGALYALASSLDLFSFWLMALLAIGFGAVIRKPALSAAWGIVVPWALYVAGKAALAAVF
jgi:hypothetical protein